MSKELLDPRTGKSYPSRKKDLGKLRFLVVHHGAEGTDKWNQETFFQHRISSALEWANGQKAKGQPAPLYAYSGLGYNYVIFPDGSFFADVPVDEMTWSTGGLNSISLSLCFAGDYMHKRPTEKALKAAEQILATLLKRHGSKLEIIGHRDAVKYSEEASATSCPGDILYYYLPELKNRVRAYVK